MLGREAFAAFVAPALEDRSAGFCTHTHAKPVGLLAPALVGLIRPFHISSLIGQRRWWPRRGPRTSSRTSRQSHKRVAKYTSRPARRQSLHVTALRQPETRQRPSAHAAGYPDITADSLFDRRLAHGVHRQAVDCVDNGLRSPEEQSLTADPLWIPAAGCTL